MAAAKARARAEAERTRAYYVKKETEMKVEKVRMEGSLTALEHEKEAAAAMAEARILEEAVESMEEGSYRSHSPIAPAADPVQRTSDYVEQHTNNSIVVPPEEISLATPPVDFMNLYGSENKQLKESSHRSVPPDFVEQVNDSVSKPYANKIEKPQSATYSPVNYWPLAQTFNSGVPMQSPSHGEVEMSDLARFLARREIISSGLTIFDDHPENYWAWKSSFLNATSGLKLSSSEQLDLLIKWLGSRSSEYVRRIRSVNIRYPDAGLKMAWDRLEEMYGSPEVVEKALFDKIEKFPKINKQDPLKLQELGDLLREVQSAKAEGYLTGLSYLDTSRGVSPIVEKLPYHLQEKWIYQGSEYKRKYNVTFPPFSFLTDFVCQEARTRNDPSFSYSAVCTTQIKAEPLVKRQLQRRMAVSTHKTGVTSSTGFLPTRSSENEPIDVEKQCPIHKNKPHPLRRCRGFRAKTLEERQTLLRENGVCYRCCASTVHLAKNCKAVTKCNECESDRHVSALHPGPPPWANKDPSSDHGGEEDKSPSPTVTSQCTEICGDSPIPKSCSKICLIGVYHEDHPEIMVKMYAVLDEQSNRSLARPEFFDLFKVKGTEHPYTLRTCAGLTETSGRRATGFQAVSMDGKTHVSLPTLIECNYMPDDHSEIPSPTIARQFPHLISIAHEIPEIDPCAKILLLLGRDIIQVHKVRKQLNGLNNSPYAQKLDFGWVIVGNVCLGSAHKPSTVDVFRTNILLNGRPSICEPCPNQIQVKEKLSSKNHPISLHGCRFYPSTCPEYLLGNTIFERTQDDEKIAPSIEDRAFLKLMDKEMFIDSSNSWVAPLPFRIPRQQLPNNRDLSRKRLLSLQQTLRKKPQMQEHFITFMQRIFDAGHAELAPPVMKNEEVWYLPIFGVYHPRKPGQIRVVFDSSAQYKGLSLNQVLLSGPDLNNSLLGVLLRFRKEAVAFTADIEQMFHSFVVREDHRNFLRFLWFEDNDLSKDVTEYRMKVHVFGNSPSPAVAIYGLHRAAQHGELEFGKDARAFVERNFYVDDGLKSVPTAVEAVGLLKRTQEMLASSNLRLHKIASNSPDVMNAFPVEDHVKYLKDLDLEKDTLPIQRSLGLSWNLKTDTFTFRVDAEEKPFTRRGVLATVNSVFDPLGLAAPVTIQGKFLLRDLTADTKDWDAPLPTVREAEWEAWKNSLQDLAQFEIPRVYSKVSLFSAKRKEIHVFSDASTKAIAAVAYLRVMNDNGSCTVGFVIGKAKLAPLSAHTVPRLELGAAVLAVEVAELIQGEMDITPDAVEFYSDSKVVLGYIHNQTRRFYVYVSNRVQRIRKSTRPEQWHYISTSQNPADHATRSVPASDLKDSTWLSGPAFLSHPDSECLEDNPSYKLIDPDSDVEVHSNRTDLTLHDFPVKLGSHRFERFSTWKCLLQAISNLIHIIHSFRLETEFASTCKKWHLCDKALPEELSQAKVVILQCIQQESYRVEFARLSEGKEIQKNSGLRTLNPFIDRDGLLRVGGRLKHAPIEQGEKHPVIIPGKSHIALLITRHFHERVKHQGRLFTEGAIRNAGFWIVGARKRIHSVIHKCIICQKLRGRIVEQKMADLPPDRLATDPPFTYVGLDVFGPWMVASRRTRGGLANSKRWVLIFTCLSIRAVHFELIDSLDASTFINALRRFFAIRGPAKQIRSDCGTNFKGACKELGMLAEELSFRSYLNEEGCRWIFNPPHASHMGGAWERLIGVARRILDSMLLQNSHSHLTYEMLATFLAEVSAIMNSRPLAPISSDPNSPALLTPATLLTQKVGVLSPPPGDFEKDFCRQKWKQVQQLASTFWERWRREYLVNLQSRRKWHTNQPNIREGDIVLMKEAQVKRNDWPMALVTKVFPGEDEKVRKIEIKVTKDGKCKTYLRPVSQVILLLSSEEQNE